MKRKTPALSWDEISVRALADAYIAQQKAALMAEQIGMSSELCEYARLITSELATNLVVHHTVDGRIRISSVDIGTAQTLTIASLDAGPGIADIEAVLSGLRNSSRGLGAGLRTVKRYSHAMEICSKPAEHYPCPLKGHHSFATIVTATLWQPREIFDQLLSSRQTFFAIGSSTLHTPVPLSVSLVPQGMSTYMTLTTGGNQLKTSKPVSFKPLSSHSSSKGLEALFDAATSTLKVVCPDQMNFFLLAKEEGAPEYMLFTPEGGCKADYLLANFEEALLIMSPTCSQQLAKLVEAIDDVSRETILGEILYYNIMKGQPSVPSALAIWKWTNQQITNYISSAWL